MSDQTTIEFYDDTVMVALLYTEAMPPPVGSKININSVDYEVVVVDYSIDRAASIQRCYRRNVHLKRVVPFMRAGKDG